MNAPSSLPRLSLVVPTMGAMDGITRMLDSVVHQAPPELLSTTELIVFLNAMPGTQIDADAIEKYIQSVRSQFHSARYIKADKFYLTAEESAWAATAHATGKFLWISGDKRIFLPEGLAQLASFMEAPAAPCACFNAIIYENDGYTNAISAAHLTKSKTTVTYKDFVQRTGVNFIATGMGIWVVQRQYMDRDVWQHIITKCGPHFSHVATLLATLGKREVTCHALPLVMYEAKAYHKGDGSEWDRYAQIAGTYRYYAWTFGLVRQFRYLIDRGVYSYTDVRRAMCSECHTLNRQIDEIYKSLIEQIWLGHLFEKERVKQNELDEILSFLSQACPERAIINGLLRTLYEDAIHKPSNVFMQKLRHLRHAINLDQAELPFSSLIIGQVGSKFIRLHPRGYLLSDVNDNVGFRLAYKLVDAPIENVAWKIIDESELTALDFQSQTHTLDSLFPVGVHKPVYTAAKIQSYIRYAFRRLRLYSIASKLVLRMPKWFVARVCKPYF